MNNRLGIAPKKLYQNMSEGKLAIYIKSQFIKARGIKERIECIEQYNLLQDISDEDINNFIHNSFILNTSIKT